MTNPKIVANWKMNGSLSMVQEWLYEFHAKVEEGKQVDSIFCPPVCYASFAKNIILENEIDIYLGAQNLDFDANLSLTGGVNATMLKDVGCNFIILGHSERRTYFLSLIHI